MKIFLKRSNDKKQIQSGKTPINININKQFNTK